MYFEEYGNRENPTIIFLHCAAIVEIYLNLYSLADRFHIIVPHLYGSGKEVETDFSFEKNEKAICELVESNGLHNVYVFGHSEGANLALALVSRYPTLFKKAIISSPMIDKTEKIAQKKARFVGSMYGFVHSRLVGKIYVRFLGIKEKERAQFFLNYWSKISKKTWQTYYTDRFTLENYPEYVGISVPILYLYGSKEPKIIKETVETLHELNEYSAIRVISGFGHEHPLKNSKALKKIIEAWFLDDAV